jgi:hypothetical protein
LYSRFVGLSGADANGALDWRNEDLAVAHLSGSCGILYRRNNSVRLLRGDHKINPDFLHKVHGILGAAINLRVSLLSAESVDLGHVMPCTPRTVSAPRTSSSLNGLIMAVTSFMAYLPFPDA